MISQEGDEEEDDHDEDAVLFEDYRDQPYSEPTLTPMENQFADESMNLLCQKGIFCYTWLNAQDKFDCNELPPRDAFFNDLKEEPCDPEDYQRAVNVWRHFRMLKMRQYIRLYLASDILHLADVFEAFRRITLDDYHIDPARFHTTGSLGTLSLIHGYFYPFLNPPLFFTVVPQHISHSNVILYKNILNMFMNALQQ